MCWCSLGVGDVRWSPRGGPAGAGGMLGQLLELSPWGRVQGRSSGRRPGTARESREACGAAYPRLMARLLTPRMRGWRRANGPARGFTYVDADGHWPPGGRHRADQSLAILPAWEDVWICPVPNGHLRGGD